MGTATKINITLSKEQLSEIDNFVERRSSTRSSFIREAARFYMNRVRMEEEENRRRRRMQEAALDIRKLRKKAGDWDGVSEIRKWRDAR